MPTSNEKSGDAKRKRAPSGAGGGAATAAGISYQIEYGMLRALDLIAQALDDPFGSYVLHVEPRPIAGNELTAWDYLIEPPDERVEVKLRPSKEDICDFLARVAKDEVAAVPVQYLLVHGQDTSCLKPINKLIRLAKEAQGNESDFTFRLAFEGTDGTSVLRQLLGDSAHEVFQRISLEQYSVSALQRNIRQTGMMLVGPDQVQQLCDLLYRKIGESGQDRLSLPAPALIEEAERNGIQFLAPSHFTPSGLASHTRSALFLLQEAVGGLPLTVLAEALDCEPCKLLADLIPYGNQKHIEEINGLWHLTPLRRPLRHPSSETLIPRALEALLDLVKVEKTSALALAQVESIICLAHKCAALDPKAVAPVFRVLHKLLQRRGDKRRVLEVAQLSIKASRDVGPNRPKEFVEYEAQALICGESWVYQRRGRITEALASAEKSIALGQGIGYALNTTFCKKCMGRLLRLQAEETDDRHERADLLAKSAAKIEEARLQFSATDGGGKPNYPEVGDCYSLLGRTYLAMGQPIRAFQAAKQAEELLTDPGDKDYLDLLILQGEIEAARGDRAAAEVRFTDALDISTSDDALKTEMRARAFCQRARNRQAQRRKADAIADYRQAAAIWRGMDERDRAEDAEWRIICLTESDTAAFRELPSWLDSESCGVRLRVLKQRKMDLAALSPSFRGRRNAPGEQYWQRLIANAREDDARETIDW